VDIPASFIWTIIFFIGSFECGDGGIIKLVRWMQNLHQSKWDHKILYADRTSEDEQLLIRPLLRELKKYEHGGRLNVKVNILFYGENSWIVARRQTKICTLKIIDIPTGFIWTIIFFDGAFECGGISKCLGYVPTSAELLLVEFCCFGQYHILVNHLSSYC
jgi:hypothetical protein